jgi:hypothetical protein
MKETMRERKRDIMSQSQRQRLRGGDSKRE